MTGDLADDEKLTIKLRLIDPLFRTDENHLHRRLARPRRWSDVRRVGACRHMSPTDERLALFGDDLVDGCLADFSLLRVRRKKYNTGRVPAAWRQRRFQLRFGDLLQELIRQRRQDAGTVSGVFFAAASSAVSHPAQHLVRVIDDLPRPLPFDVRDEADATGIMLERRIVQPLFLGHPVAVKLNLSHLVCFFLKSSPAALCEHDRSCFRWLDRPAAENLPVL